MGAQTPAYGQAQYPYNQYLQPRRAAKSKGRLVTSVVAVILAFCVFAGGVGVATMNLINVLTPSNNVSVTEPQTQPYQPYYPDREQGTESGGQQWPDDGGQQWPGEQQQQTFPQDSTTAVSQRVTDQQAKGIVIINADTGSGVAAGTGMILSSDGKVLTNYHVVAGTIGVAVQVATTKDTYTATLVGFDQVKDVALLQLKDASNLETITVDDDGVQLSDAVSAVGNAGGGNTLVRADGYVTSLSVDVSVNSDSPWGNEEDLENVIETNAAAEPGDSGGPMFDDEGEVIGMTTAGSEAEGISYAVPIDTALDVVETIEKGQDVGTVRVGPAGYLGITVADTDSHQRRSLGRTIAGVSEGGPAAQAGLVANAVITDIGGTTIYSDTNLAGVIRVLEPGDRVSVTWVNPGGAEQTATVTLEASPVN
ncbi:MAG: S1C family serine protease [Propionibacteriaceae bacterium]|nr:S1C family serine protease [Propionibacteriaceae bacterium]